MKKSIISVNRMIETYVANSLSDETWRMFYMMYCHNLITGGDWDRFFNTCRGWQFDNEGFAIIDSDDNDAVVYEADEYGIFHKVK